MAVGADADFVLVDLDKEQRVDSKSTHSQFTSAFDGLKLKGWPVMTIRRGEIIFRDGEVLAKPGSGQVVHRTPVQSAGY